MIFAYFSPEFFFILSLLLTSISHVTRSLPSSNNRYDLDDGPVTYQAYYPDSYNVQTEKRYFDREPIIEESYQTPYNTENNRNDLSDFTRQQSAEFSSNTINNINNDKYYRDRVEDAVNILVDVIQHKRAEYNGINTAHDNHHPRHMNFEDRRQIPSNDNSLIAENIFQPRPQVIHYVFSPPKTQNTDNVDDEKNISQQPVIQSLEVSGEHKHRIRHHHGERLQRKIDH